MGWLSGFLNLISDAQGKEVSVSLQGLSYYFTLIKSKDTHKVYWRANL